MALLLAVQQQTVWKPRVFWDRTEPLETWLHGWWFHSWNDQLQLQDHRHWHWIKLGDKVYIWSLNNPIKFRTKIPMHCCNINKGRRGNFFLVHLLYIKENRTPLSPRRPLIGSSWDFTHEHTTDARGWKWSRSDIDCGFLIKLHGKIV